METGSLDALVEGICEQTIAYQAQWTSQGKVDPYIGRAEFGEDFLDGLASQEDDICVNAHVPVFDSFHSVHSNSFYELVYVYAGQVKLEVVGLFYELNGGDVVFLNSGVLHAVQLASDNARVVNILFRRRLLCDAFFNIILGHAVMTELTLPSFFAAANMHPFIVFREAAVRCINWDLDVECFLREYLGSWSTRRNVLKLRLGLLLEDIARGFRDDAETVGTLAQSGINLAEVISHIQNHLKAVTLEEVASKFHYTPRHFSKLIRDVYGKTFSGLLQDLRVYEAQKLLQSTDLPINDIIRSVGYSNKTHFYHIFLDRVGTVPAAYRDYFLKARQNTCDTKHHGKTD